MATFLYDFINSLDESWNEVELLLAEAKKYESTKVDLYNALCRSITVLIVAHLEGFVKELVKAIVHDFNSNYIFKDLSLPIQRTYCKKYLGNGTESDSKSYQNKMIVLIDKFCEVECKISPEPFFLSNKNPKPDAFKIVFENFGIKSVFSHLHNSKFDSVFSDSPKETKENILKQKKYILSVIKVFPYVGNLSRMALDVPQAKPPKRTLWQEFLDQINMKRHGVAHGTDIDNAESVSVLESVKDKVIFFQLALLELLICEMNKAPNQAE